MSADGTWNISVNSPMGVQRSELSIKTAGDNFSGTMTSPQGKQEVNGKISGDTLSWSNQMTAPMPMTLEFTVKIAGDDMTGSVKAGAFGNMPVSGKRG